MFPAGQDGSGSEGRHAERPEETKAVTGSGLSAAALANSPGEDKTQIVHAETGFDFLGFNVRRYRSGKLLIKPSKAAVKRIRGRLREEIRALRGAEPAAVLRTLNPVIRGWAAYYRTVVSKEVFAVNRSGIGGGPMC